MSGPAAWAAGITDPERLAAVERSALVDSAPEDAFDRLTELAALVTRTRRACITIVDGERYRYKSTIGVPEGADQPGPVEESFCRYVVGSGQPFYVDDAAVDPRTFDHPAIEALGIAAWAGYPIEDEDGWVLGTFCLIDDKPRDWTDEDLHVLATLARVASSEIALRNARAVIAAARQAVEEGESSSAVPSGGPDHDQFLLQLSRAVAELGHPVDGAAPGPGYGG